MIGIIGFGRFARLMIKSLNCKPLVFDRRQRSREIIAIGGIPSGLDDVCRCRFVIPCVPISEFENVIKGIADKVKNNTVIDVCSVKEYPAKVMETHLPETVNIIATHPLFGPDSASLENKKVVVCRVRCDDKIFCEVMDYLRQKRLEIIEASPAAHDEQIAKTQGLTHLIGRALREFNAVDYQIDTLGYKRLQSILSVVKNDSWQLFSDMNKYNRFSNQVREDFLDAMEKTIKEIEK